MLSELARFDPFQTYGMSELKLLAAHSKYLDVPAGRWLLQRGRKLSGHHFLLRGALRTCAPDGVVQAGTRRARAPVYPGPRGLRTLSDCRLLQISETGLELAAMRAQLDLVTVTEADGCWQARFLQSHLMAPLPPATWQLVLARLHPVPLPEGAWVLREGARHRDFCCILASGRAEVRRRNRTLAWLESGDLFGEDALISREPRNASVRMSESGVVMRLHSDDFSRFLIDVLDAGGFEAPPVQVRDSGSRSLLRIASAVNLRERLERLDAEREYLVSSGDPGVLALTVFLLRKRGIRAWAAPGS